MKKAFLIVLLASLLAAAPGAFAFEKVSYEVAKALKVQTGKSIDTGLVFVDGKFLKPPYRVKRYGNQIMVNNVPVTGPLVSWEELLKTQENVKVTEVEVEDAETPGAKPSAAPAEDGVDPAAPKDGGNTPPPADESAKVVRTVEPMRYAAAEDDLEDFKPNDGESMKLKDVPADTEEDIKRRKRLAEEKKAEEEEAEKDLEDDEEEEKKTDESKGSEAGAAEASDEPLDPASPEGEAAAKKAAKNAPPPPPAAPKKTRKVYSLEGAFDMNYRAKQLMKPIEAERAKIESILKRGGYIFFTTHARRVTGESFGSKKLLEKLPKMMRDAKDSESFCDDIRNEGLLSYMNFRNAQDLYRNKTDFAALMECRRALAEAEKLKKLMNR